MYPTLCITSLFLSFSLSALLLLLCGDIHPNPGPELKPLEVLQWNCAGGGIQKLVELFSFLDEGRKEKLDIICIQEIKIEKGMKYELEGFNSFIRPRTKRGGGVATLVRKGLFSAIVDRPSDQIHGQEHAPEILEVCVALSPPPTTDPPNDMPPNPPLEGVVHPPTFPLCETIPPEDHFSVINGYFPRGPSDAADVEHLSPHHPEGRKRAVFCVDANAHHPYWDGFIHDAGGDLVAGWVIEHGVRVCNDARVSTRQRATGEVLRDSSPDITFAFNLPVLNWSTHRVATSDHDPIFFTIDKSFYPPPPRGRPTFNFKKARWSRFQECILSRLHTLDNIPPHVQYSHFSCMIEWATKMSVPRGIPGEREKRKGLEQRKGCWEEVGEKAAAVDTALQEYIECRDGVVGEGGRAQAFARLNERLREFREEQSEQRTQLFAEKVSRLRNDSAAWRMLKNVSRSTPEVSDPQDDKGLFVVSRCTAVRLGKFFSDVCSKSLDTPPLTFSVDTSRTPVPIVSLEEYLWSVKTLGKGKACGPDGVYVESLLHLPKEAVVKFLCLLSNSIQTGFVPQGWRTASVVPLLKPGKDSKQNDSYRPISLTSVLSKLTEKIVQRRVLLFMEENNIHLSSHQSGFRSHRCTLDQLQIMFNFINRSRPASHASVLFVDFSKAFDKVDHTRLISVLSGKGIPPYLVRWINNWLVKRTLRVKFDKDKHTPFFAVGAGVPQGSVLGPLLFLFYVDSLSEKFSEEGIRHGFFADDLTVFAEGTDSEICNTLQRSLVLLEQWAGENGMSVNASKSQIMHLKREVPPIMFLCIIMLHCQLCTRRDCSGLWYPTRDP